MPQLQHPVKSPFRFRLDRRDSSALVEAWVVLSRQRADGKYELVDGPFTLNGYNRPVEHTEEIVLDPGRYRVKVEMTITEAHNLAGLYNFRFSARDKTRDQMIYDESNPGGQSIDTSNEIDVVAGADVFAIDVA